MEMWKTLRFGTRAMSLKMMAVAPAEALQQRQLKRLRRLVGHAKQRSPYLQEKYADIDSESCQLADLPTCDKQEIMENFDRWVTDHTVKRASIEAFFEDADNLGELYQDKYVVSHTSGSTGQPLLLVKSPGEFELIFALQAARGHRTSLSVKELVARFAEPVRLAAVTMQPGFYPSGSAFEYMPEAIRNFIEVLQLSFSDPDMLKRLEEFRPTHLTAYASILHELARNIETGDLKFDGCLEQVVNISERLMPEPRRKYEELFEAPILDDYGMGECLFLTSGCMTSDGMHINSDWAIVENVDENYQPVPPGERGTKVLLTNLSNRVQPFIRYEINDIIVMAEQPCECGINLPLIERVEGRSSNIFYARDGEGLRPFLPAILEQAIIRSPRVREYQLVQHEPERLEVRLEPIAGETIDIDAVREHVMRQLESNGVPTIEVEVAVVDRLVAEADASKFKRIVCEVEPPGGEV